MRNPSHWTVAALLFGLSLRLVHYCGDPSVWHDEAALIVNVLDKDFGEQLGPLALHEAAPPGFLWMVRAVSLTFGDSTFALRLVPLLASCLALLLFARLARNWLVGACEPWAVLAFACSDRLLWHACEAKPYATDVFLATLVLTVFTETRGWPVGRQILLHTLLSPLLIFLAYPGCFLCGGLLVALLPAVCRARRARLWLGYGLWSIVVACCFLLLLLGPIQAQQSVEMRSCWTELFPDWSRLPSVPAWVVRSTADVVHYVCNPIGEYLAFLAVIGGFALWRRGERAWLIVLALPWALALVAALLHAYPYGGARVLAYTAPAVFLLLAAGLPDTFAWLHRRAAWGRYVLLVVLAMPLGNALYRVVVPWKRADASGAASFVIARRGGAPVYANNWEYLYYFRHDPKGLPELEKTEIDPARPLWVIVTTLKRAERRHLLKHLAEGRVTLERHEFALTTVLLLSPAIQ
jgi:hypothetical protein